MLKWWKNSNFGNVYLVKSQKNFLLKELFQWNNCFKQRKFRKKSSTVFGKRGEDSLRLAVQCFEMILQKMIVISLFNLLGHIGNDLKADWIFCNFIRLIQLLIFFHNTFKQVKNYFVFCHIISSRFITSHFITTFIESYNH